MKTRILIISIILIGLGASGVFVYENFTKPEAEKVETPLIINEEVNSEAKEEEVFKETILVKDDFAITLPAGWQEVKDFPEVLFMAVDDREEITDEKLKNIDFRTNFSIKTDDMGKYSKISNTEEYVESVKASLIQIIPDIKFIHEEQSVINNNNAFFVEVESNQEEIDFKTLLVFIEGNNNAIWAISFNTLQNSWPGYKNSFYQTAESFNFRYKLEF